MDRVADNVAGRVSEQAMRTENTLRSVIGVLVILAGVFVLMYVLSRRQLLRERAAQQQVEQDYRSMGAAVALLDDETRKSIQGKLDEYRAVGRSARPEPTKKPDEPAGRSDDYLR
jgi:flagellar biosynthesis/type III secretory pathway M-ring protein FliF/YscJ